MRVLDPDHKYLVQSYDGDMDQVITFMKREGEGYPGNIGSNPGTNCQELIRILIDRVEFLNLQFPCDENNYILNNLRSALFYFEFRAANRHGRALRLASNRRIENVDVCPKCGHIECGGH